MKFPIAKVLVAAALLTAPLASLAQNQPLPGVAISVHAFNFSPAFGDHPTDLSLLARPVRATPVVSPAFRTTLPQFRDGMNQAIVLREGGTLSLASSPRSDFEIAQAKLKVDERQAALARLEADRAAEIARAQERDALTGKDAAAARHNVRARPVNTPQNFDAKVPAVPSSILPAPGFNGTVEFKRN